jgi:hypothetical protein
MKPVKNLVFATLLVSSIALNTLAGDVETPGYAPPPPRATYQDPTTISNTEETGDVLAEASDYLLLEALTALLSVY